MKKRAISGYLFISPFILGFLLFMVKPMIDSINMSFNNVTLAPGGYTMAPVKLFNYNRALTVDAEFVRMLTDELKRIAINVPAILVFSFFVALILNQRFKGRTLVRAIFFLPVILSSGVIIGMENDNTLLQEIGDIIKESNAISITATMEEILRSSGLGSRMVGIVVEVINRIYDVALASGIQMIIFLSGLQTVPSSMYEAARIEGSTSWECFWKITLPMVSPLLLVNVVYSFIDSFVKTDNQIMNKLNTLIVVNLEYGMGTAMAWMYFGTVMLIIGAFVFLISKVVYYYE